MKKNYLLVGAGILALGAASLTPISAAQTEVTVGVSDTKPPVISMDVPATIPMAVVTDATKAADKPTVMIGTSTTGVTDPGVHGTGSAILGEGTGAFNFKNTGTTAAKVTGATIVNTAGSGWTLTSAAPGAANEMSLDLGGFTTGANLLPGTTGALAGTDLNVGVGATTQVTVKAIVGGTNADYTNKADATVFHVNWTIGA